MQIADMLHYRVPPLKRSDCKLRPKCLISGGARCTQKAHEEEDDARRPGEPRGLIANYFVGGGRGRHTSRRIRRRSFYNAARVINTRVSVPGAPR